MMDLVWDLMQKETIFSIKQIIALTIVRYSDGSTSKLNFD